MKYSKSEILSRAYKIPELKFEDQNLTSFAGLVIFQPLMLGLEIKNRLFHCFRHIFGHAKCNSRSPASLGKQNP